MKGLRVNDEQTLSKIYNNAFDNGLLILKAGKITLRFLPPLTITKDEIDEGFRRLNSAVASI
jgi:acetylornithine aminotransferase